MDDWYYNSIDSCISGKLAGGYRIVIWEKCYVGMKVCSRCKHTFVNDGRKICIDCRPKRTGLPREIK